MSPRSPAGEITRSSAGEITRSLAGDSARRIPALLHRRQHLAGLLGVTARRPANARRIEVDARALLVWILVGIEAMEMPALDAEPARRGPWMPAARVVSEAARRVALTLAMERHISITSAAEALQTSRRALRDSLKRHGLYEQFRGRFRRPRTKAKPLPSPEVIGA